MSQKFQEFCQHVQSCPVTANKIRNLKMKKHRFDSLQRPLGRTILWLDAVIMTAIWVVAHRKGQAVAKACAAFLAFLSEERVLMLGMCADGADEAIRIVRYLDTECHDISEVPLETMAFLSRIDFLFTQGNCVNLGYTAHCLTCLKRARGFMLGDEPKTIGGPGRVDQSIIERCLRRMQCWTRLAVSVVRAEFPSWELLYAFGLRDVSGRAARQGSTDAEQQDFRQSSLARLATVFGVDLNTLTAEFEDHEPIAQSLYKQARISCWEAWADAVKRTQLHASSRARHPAVALKEVLLRYGAYNGATSSGVEQCFTIQNRACRPERNHMELPLELDELKLQTDHVPTDVPDILQSARILWTQRYGKPRTSVRAQPRLDKGTKRKKETPLPSNIAWVGFQSYMHINVHAHV